MSRDALIQAVVRDAERLEAARRRVTRMEFALAQRVQEYVESYRGGLRDLSRHLGFSAAYICDIRYGRRKISAEFVKRMQERDITSAPLPATAEERETEATNN